MAGKDGVPEDLNMIQPEKSIEDVSFEDMVKNAKRTSQPTSASITNPSEARASVMGMYDKNMQAQSMQEGSVDPELDQFQSSFEDTGDVRARNQSGWVKGAKAIGGGIYTGALIVLEELGYMADVKTYTNMFTDAEDLSGNAWSNMFKDLQESGRESELFKIYDKDSDENSVLSQIFKWSSLEGAVSSAVGFGIPGLGAAALVSKLGNIRQFGKLAKFTDKIMGNIKATGLTGQAAAKAMQGAQGGTRAFVGPMASSALSNFYMGQVMATDTYSQSMAALEGKIESGELDRLEAQKMASHNAQDVVELNMALAATGMIRFGNIFKSGNRLKGLIKDPSAMNQLKDMVMKGAPTAFVENVYQEVIQMEQIHKTSRAFDVASKYSEDYWDRISQLALSDRAIHAGALGIVGGPIQFAIIQKPLMREQLKKQAEGFKNQQETLTYHKALRDNNLKTFAEFEGTRNKAIISGDISAANLTEEMALINEIVKSSDWGTLDYLKHDIEKEMKRDPEEVAETTDYDGNYQERGQAALDIIDRTEQILFDFPSVEGRGDVVYNRLVSDSLNRSKVETIKKYFDETVAMNKEKIEEVGLPADTVFNEEGNIVREESRFDNLGPDQIRNLRATEKTQDKKINIYKTTSPRLKAISKIERSLNKMKGITEDLDAKLTYILSTKGQEEIKQQEVEATRDAAEASTNLETDAKDTEQVTKSKNSQTFAKVKNTVPIESSEERSKREVAWEKDIKEGAFTSIKEGQTFTSKDTEGVSRLYTPNDIVRSFDGRTFKVLGQIGADTGAAYSNMPLLGIMSPKGKQIGSFRLEDNTFLRPEVDTGVRGKNGKYFNKGDWAPYLVPDSYVRPNHLNTQLARQDKATKGIAISVNGMEVESTRPGPGETLVSTALAERYDLATLNLPVLEGEAYDIELKLNKEDGQTIIDVYRRGNDKPITRLDKQSNLNHAAIAKALLKGEVTGRVEAHYSSKNNIVTLKDAEGLNIRRGVADLSGMNAKYLPNGKVYLSTTKGTKGTNTEGSPYATIGQDGEIIEDSFILHTKENGEKVQLTIPYNSMTAGDTYALMISPSGKLIPTALRNTRVGDLESTMGLSSRVDDIIQMTQEGFNEVYDDILQDETSYDAVLRENIATENLSPSDAAYQFLARKRKDMQSRQEQLNAKLDETAYSVIRPENRMFTKYITADGGWEWNTTAKGSRYTRVDHFRIQAGVSKDGTIGPEIQISDKGVGFIKYNIKDNPVEFTEELGARFLKNSIESFRTKEKADELFNNSGLTTDINISQPFAGSSATIQINGEDIRAIGEVIVKGVTKNQRKVKSLRTKATEADKLKLVEDMEAFLTFDPNSETDSLGIFASVESVEEFTEAAIAYVTGLPLANKFIGKTFRDVIESKDDLTAIGLEGLSKAKEAGLTDIAEPAAKVYEAVADLIERIKNGDETVLSTTTKDKDVNPRSIQPEGQKFTKGTRVYNAMFGEGIISKFRLDGKAEDHYFMTQKSTGKNLKVYPNTTVIADSKYVELYKLRKSLSRMGESHKNYQSTLEKKIAIENKLYKNNVPDSELNTPESTPADPTTRSEVAGDVKAIAKVTADLDATGATEELIGKRTNLESLYAQVDDWRATSAQAKLDVKAKVEGAKVINVVTLPNIELVHKTLKDNLMYTDGQLEGLIDAAREAAIDNKELAVYENVFQGLKDLNKGLREQTEYKGFQNVYGRYLPENHGRFNDLTKPVEKRGKYMTFIQPSAFAVKGEPMTALFLLKSVREYNQQVDSVVRGIAAITAHNATKGEVPAKVETPSAAPKVDTVVTPVITKEPVIDKTEEDISWRSESERELYVTGKELGLTDQESSYIADTLKGKEAKEAIDSISNMVDLGVEPREAFKSAARKYDFDPNADVPFKIGSDVTLSKEQFEYEVSKAKEMLPQVAYEVLENVTAMVNKFGANAIGAYHKGVVTLVQGAKTGTAYHEVFHGVSDLFLRPFEKQAIAEERGQAKWTTELEESLADDFAAYVNNKESVSGRIKSAVSKFFNGLLNWFKGARSVDITTQIFERVASNGYSTSKSIQYLGAAESHTKSFNTMEGFSASLSQKESVTLQNLISDNRIKIIC